MNFQILIDNNNNNNNNNSRFFYFMHPIITKLVLIAEEICMIYMCT